MTTKNINHFVPSITVSAGIIFCTLLWSCLFFYPMLLGKHLLLPFNGHLLIFSYSLWTTLWLIGCLVIPLLTILIFYQNCKKGAITQDNNPLLFLFSPLVLLPIPLILAVLRLDLNQQLIANILFFVPAFIFSYILFKAFNYSSHYKENTISFSSIFLVGVFFIIFYSLIGWYFTLSSGEHSGDEGHYIIQAESLHQDNDLELYNNFNERQLNYIEKGAKNYIHISPTAKKGKFYSWHPYGLPLYLSILPPNNYMLRHLLLGILSGIGSAGLLLLCKHFNVTRQTALLFVFLFSLSPLWGIYTSRVLPEMPGAVLAIWTAIALFAVRKHPWIAAILIIFCCGYLPFLHPRFVPVSFFGYMFFVLYFTKTRQFKSSLPVILFTTVGLICAAGIYLYVNSLLFTTAISYSPNQFKPYLAGMWEVLTTTRSITYIMPSFFWMLAATLLVFFILKKNKYYIAFTIVSFLSVLALSCSNSGWTGGASTMGRYLLVVAPLFIPIAAYYFDRTNHVARWWFIFLSVIPLMHFALLLIRLPEFGASFGDPRYYIGVVYDYFKGLLNPFPPARATSFFPFWGTNGFAFPILFFGFTLLLLLQNHKKRATLAIVCPVIITASAIYYHHPEIANEWSDLEKRGELKSKQENATAFMINDMDNAYIRSKLPEQKYPIFQASNFLEWFQGENLASITNQLSYKKEGNGIIFQPDMPSNDWKDRPIFWTTLGKRFTTQPIKSAFFLDGTLIGDVEAQLLVIEMGGKKHHILLDKKFKTTGGSLVINEKTTLHPTGDGKVHILVRLLNGRGSFITDAVGWTPATPHILEKANAYLPNVFEHGGS